MRIKSILYTLNRDFYKRPNDLKIPPFNQACFDHTPSPVLSPEGRVAARLDKISQEIMEMVPNLLDEPLKIIQAGSLSSYEQFCTAARHLTFDHQIVGWSKVALLCHFAREVAIIGELDDMQLELLAEHSLKFIEESTAEWIEKKGGWVSTVINHAKLNNARIVLLLAMLLKNSFKGFCLRDRGRLGNEGRPISF